MPTTFTDNLKFYLSFAVETAITLPKAVLSFIFYSIIHQLLGFDPAPKQAVERAFRRDIKPCPYARALGSHEYIAPDDFEGTRGPCPALNVMANHGYLPRDGQNISGFDLTRALMECYNLSWPLAAFLSWGGVVLLGQAGLLCLPDLARHNRIEHDASITHANAPKGHLYAPRRQDPNLQELYAKDERNGFYTVNDIARARVRREAEPGTQMTSVQQEVARGEVALVLQIFGGETFAIPKEDLHTWWFEERLPEGWKPTRQTPLLGTINWSSKLRNAMNALRDTASTETSTAVVSTQIEERPVQPLKPQPAKKRRTLPVVAP